jgi:hypothetical protein
MPLTPAKPNKIDAPTRCFGLRIESQLLQVATASQQADGRYRLEIDDIECSSSSGWLAASGTPLLLESLAMLVDRHEMRRQSVAVSLDGDFCVTRVTMGTTEHVDAELSMQADRIPRYLQLGPGEKVTGGARSKIAPNVDYAVTGVVNRSLIQLIYDALRETDIDVTWVEPSLVSIARMVGQAKIGGDQPVMIADGMGKQWDVGIACSGRLLLDYRPAAATDEETFRDALDGHISRLKRFCLRHRGIATGELSRLLICGFGEKPHRAVEALGDSLGVQPEVLYVPDLTELYEIDEQNRQSPSVPAVATVLPLLTGVDPADVPDLLAEVRRAPELPLATRVLQSCWPIAAALLILCTSYGLVSGQRRHRAGTVQGRAELESQIDATEVKFAELTQKRELLSYLKQIEGQTAEPNWDLLLGRITQSLPDSCRLNEYRVESDGHVLLDGTVLDESIVYELVNSLRKLPGVTQVALRGTTPEESVHGTRFVIRLMTSRPEPEADSGARDE